MTIYGWHKLDEQEQTEVLWEAEVIGNYTDDTYLYTAYQRPGDWFYIETKRHIAYNVLHGMRAFTNPDLLILYFDSMGDHNLKT